VKMEAVLGIGTTGGTEVCSGEDGLVAGGAAGLVAGAPEL